MPATTSERAPTSCRDSTARSSTTPRTRADPGRTFAAHPGTAGVMTHPIVVMGVSGSGKSTVGAALAGRMHVPFEDADDLHPPANIAKMTRGEPLDDDDRWPWLERIGEWLVEHADGGVIACSALKRKYRD